MDSFLPYVALVSAFFAAVAVLFSIIRPRFPARVNCWFCQKDLLVDYHERDSWECPHCEQYNGFSADGGYNKILPAQFNSLMNPEPRNQGGTFFIKDKLCQSCARNQELKVQQLSSFSPKCEETFEVEAKQFKCQLDQMYRLCRECDRSLEMKLAQEEQILKPKVLAWKLSVSKKHSSGTKNMICRVHLRCIHTAKCIGYLCCWIILVFKMTEYGLDYYGDSEYSSKNIRVLIKESQMKLQTIGFIGLFSSASKLMLVKTRQWNAGYTTLWAMLVSCSFSQLFAFDKLLLVITLCVLNISEILFDAMKPRKVITVKTRTLRKASKSSESCDTKDVSLSSNGLHHSTPKSSSPYDLDISKLDIGPRYKSVSSDYSKSPPPSRASQCFARPKPIISPSRLGNNSVLSTSNGNLTKASWVAGGYWQSNNWQSPSFAASSPNYSYPLSRSSSQSSGFGSIHTAGHNRSPCESRPGSPFAEIDRLSVFSDNFEPRSAESSLRYHEHLAPASPTYPSDSGVTRRPVSSTSVIRQESAPKTNSISPSSHWFLPFLLGFSLAVNICVFGYFVVHSAPSFVTK